MCNKNHKTDIGDILFSNMDNIEVDKQQYNSIYSIYYIYGGV